MLHKGEVFEYYEDCTDAGQLFECLRVTPCSAVCRPLARVSRTVTDGRTGKTVTFTAPASTFTISPSASVRIVEHGA